MVQYRLAEIRYGYRRDALIWHNVSLLFSADTAKTAYGRFVTTILWISKASEVYNSRAHGGFAPARDTVMAATRAPYASAASIDFDGMCIKTSFRNKSFA